MEFDAGILLKRLRKRRDLFAAIADDIDDLVDGLKKMKASDIDPIQYVKPAPAQLLTEEALSNHDSNYAGNKIPEHSLPMTYSERLSKPLQRQQLKGVMILGVSAMVLGITANYLRYGLFFFPLVYIVGGIIAGFISGGNTNRIVGSFIGLCIPLLFFAVYPTGGLILPITKILFPSLGAGIVILFERRRRKNKTN